MPLRLPSPTIQPLQAARVGKLMTQHELARIVKCDQQTISRLEVGFWPPTRKQLAILCQFFHMRPDALFKEEVLREVERRVKTPIDPS